MKVCTEFGDENNKAKCVGESDVSPFSNGDKAICDEIPLEVKIVSVYSYGFVITWTPFNTTDMDHRKFLGYMVCGFFCKNFLMKCLNTHMGFL